MFYLCSFEVFFFLPFLNWFENFYLVIILFIILHCGNFCTQKRQMELAAESAKYNNNNSNNNRSFTGANTSNGDDAVIMDHSGMEDALDGTFLPVVFCFVFRPFC